MTNEEKIDLKKEIEEQDGYEYSDELFFTGEGDLLDTAEGRAKFCRINETTVFHRLEQLYLGVQQSGHRNDDKAPEPR